MRSIVCLLAAAALAACGSSGAPPKVVTVTRQPSTAGSSSATASASTGSSGSGTPKPAPKHLTRIPGTCDTLLPEPDVIEALGGASVPGVTAFVVGTPEADIGRLGYLNCRYGVTGKGAAATPKIEIGISLYATAAKANARITATVDDYAAHGATATDTAVNGRPAKLLTGGIGAGYAEPLLVVASGQRTVAVSIAAAVASGDRAAKDATSLAELALARTGG